MAKQWRVFVFLALAFGSTLLGPTLADMFVEGYDGGAVMRLVQREFYLMVMSLFAPLFLTVIFIPLYPKYKLIVFYPFLLIGLLILSQKLFDIQYLSLTQEGEWLYAVIILIIGIAASIILWKTSTETDSVDLRQTLRIVMGFVLIRVTISNPVFAWEYNRFFLSNELFGLYAIIGVGFSFGFHLVTALLISLLFASPKEPETATE